MTPARAAREILSISFEPMRMKVQQEASGSDAREPASASCVQIEDALTDHGAASHSSEERPDKVARALGHGLAIRSPTGISNLIDEVEREERFHQPDDRKYQGVSGMRRTGPRKTRDHRASPGTGEVCPQPDDFPLSSLPCKSASHQGGYRYYAAAPACAVAGATPTRARTNGAAILGKPNCP